MSAPPRLPTTTVGGISFTPTYELFIPNDRTERVSAGDLSIQNQIFSQPNVRTAGMALSFVKWIESKDPSLIRFGELLGQYQLSHNSYRKIMDFAETPGRAALELLSQEDLVWMSEVKGAATAAMRAAMTGEGPKLLARYATEIYETRYMNLASGIDVPGHAILQNPQDQHQLTAWINDLHDYMISTNPDPQSNLPDKVREWQTTFVNDLSSLVENLQAAKLMLDGGME